MWDNRIAQFIENSALKSSHRKKIVKFYGGMYIEEKNLMGIDNIHLTFRRKLSRSSENKAAVITVPRPIAHLWEQYDSVDIIFNGDCLVIRPTARVEFGDVEDHQIQ